MFRNRYKSEGIYDESHLYNCINYIYNNPVKAGICNNPEEYPYSNYKPIQKQLSEKYIFMDIDEDLGNTYKEFIKRFLENKNINKSELKNNSKTLYELVKILYDEYGISLRKIAEELNIGKEKIRQLYKK